MPLSRKLKLRQWKRTPNTGKKQSALVADFVYFTNPVSGDIIIFMNKHLKFILAILSALAVLYFGGQLAENGSADQSLTEPEISATELINDGEKIIDPAFAEQTNALVVRVVDGDTLVAKLDNEPSREQKVRLLGVDTPETVDPRRSVECFGQEASSFAKIVLTGQRIRLEADPEADEMDKYGRLLRNLYMKDGLDFNATLVVRGFANTYLSFPLNEERKVQLRRLEKQAKQDGAGLWSDQACAGSE